MGMSASQARLLYLTAQLNNLSLKGQSVSDAKTRLAMDTEAIQEKYIKALNSSRRGNLFKQFFEWFHAALARKTAMKKPRSC